MRQEKRTKKQTTTQNDDNDDGTSSSSGEREKEFSDENANKENNETLSIRGESEILVFERPLSATTTCHLLRVNGCH